MNQLQTLGQAVSVGNLESYAAWAGQVPMLTQEEETQLARDWVQHADVNAARQLVLAHLKFVIKIARGYSGYGLAQADLIQEGNIGLMKAVKRFDPEMGVRLVSFAVHWIKAEMHEFILKNWRIVKVATTKAQRKLFFNLRKAKKRLGWFSQQEVKDVAEELGVPEKTVLEMEQRLNAHDASFDISQDDDDEQAYHPAQYLTSDSPDPADALEAAQTSTNGHNDLSAALLTLDERSKDIVSSRWLQEKKATLHELAAKYKVSAERIRQLEKTAMAKLKAAIAL